MRHDVVILILLEKDVGGDQVAQTYYGMPLDGEKKKVRCHLINCILVHAKVLMVSVLIRYDSATSTICSRAQNRVQVDAPSKRACPKT